MTLTLTEEIHESTFDDDDSAHITRERRVLYTHSKWKMSRQTEFQRSLYSDENELGIHRDQRSGTTSKTIGQAEHFLQFIDVERNSGFY